MEKMEEKTEFNQLNSQHVQSIIIKKVRMKTDPGHQAPKRQKILHTYTVENHENSPHFLTKPDLDSNNADNNNEIKLSIPKTEERMADEYQDTDFDQEEELLFPELGSKNNVVTTYYAENASAVVNVNDSEELMDENSQSTLFNTSDIPSKSIQTSDQAGKSNNSINTASDSALNGEIEYGTNFESERNLENLFLTTPKYSHREIPVKNSVVKGEPIYGIICEENSQIQWTYDKDDPDLSDQLKIYVKFLKLKVDILNFITESFKDKFKYHGEQFCFKNHCQDRKCQSVFDCLKKQHYETNNWLENLNPTNVWYIITSVLEKPDTPPYLFFSHIIDWLCKKRDITKIMWIAKKLANQERFKTPETEYSEVWSCILKSLILLKMKRWSAISILLYYCHENDFPQVTTRIIFSLKLQQVTYPNYWKCFLLLVELKFQLPQIILAKILECCCDRNLPIRGNDKFILEIAAQVSQIKKTDFTRMRDLVQNFLKDYEPLIPSALKIKIKTAVSVKQKTIISEKHIIKRIKNLSLNAPKKNVLQENNNMPSIIAPETNVDNVLISLQNAIESQDKLGIAKILVLNCNAPSNNKIGKKFYYLMQNKENIGTQAVKIMSQIDKITPKRKDKLLFAKLCIDLMFFLANNDKWTEAYQFLTLVRCMKYNPPIVHSLTGVNSAVTCSQVLLNSGHYNSAINVIINNKLLYEDQTKWLVEGNKKEFVLIKNAISTLFSKFLSTKMIRFAIRLFKEVIKIQESLFAPINIFSTFESMLKQLFMNFDTNKDLAMDLFLTVYELNEEVQFDKLTNRLLIICAMRNQVYHIVHGLVSFAITSHAYPIKQSKKNTITLYTDLLEEEMMAYIIIWCGWFYNRIVNEPQSSNANININIELKEVNNEEDQELPNILKSVDSSLSSALLRVNSAIGKVINVQNIFSETFSNCNPINLSTATSQKLISSAFQFFVNKEASQVRETSL